ECTGSIRPGRRRVNSVKSVRRPLNGPLDLVELTEPIPGPLTPPCGARQEGDAHRSCELNPRATTNRSAIRDGAPFHCREVVQERLTTGRGSRPPRSVSRPGAAPMQEKSMFRLGMAFALATAIGAGAGFSVKTYADEKKPADKPQVVEAKKMPPITA